MAVGAGIRYTACLMIKPASGFSACMPLFAKFLSLFSVMPKPKLLPLAPVGAALFALLSLAACQPGSNPGVWNNPYPASESGQNILYSAFTERPRHLDPAQSYTEDEATFTAQIYEPPLQYHYLKRPYTLISTTLTALPDIRYLDRQGKPLPESTPASQVAESVYTLTIRPGIRYQPHPAFAKDTEGKPVNIGLPPAVLHQKHRMADFAAQGSKELTADDYIYQIKRLAHPRLHSPVFGMMAEHIVGLAELGKTLQKAVKTSPKGQWLDLDQFALSGVEKLDTYRFRIRLQGKYPQFQYWLAMPFFAPVPREVDQFYSQPGMAENNLTLDWWPVGTGPYLLAENDPNRRMVLAKNPNYHGETYPCEGEAAATAPELLQDCGKLLPQIDQVILTREKESIPYWNKFLQGYYDASGISSDSFDQAVRINLDGDVSLSDSMRDKGIRLLTSVKASTSYLGFNMQDALVGGLNERSTKLRQAISIAVDQEEYITIFMNGRGIPAMSPLPPGIFGYQEGRAGMNPYVYDWIESPGKPGHAQRKPVSEARRLLAEAGYPNGRDAKTGEPLVLYLDTTAGSMGEKSRLDWLVRQFQKLDIQLVVRATDFNRFQDKLTKGAVQLYYLGWNADYPDPENFFFLLESSQGKVAHGGENASNYSSPEFDRLFAEMKYMNNTPERLKLVARINARLQQDAPWVFAYHPKSYTLGHRWLYNRMPHEVANNTLKYQRLDARTREALRQAWNGIVLWPLLLVALFLLLLGWPAWRAWQARENFTPLVK
jgi:ABC-type transport system substrate-binding protein